MDEQHFLWFDHDRVEMLLVSQDQDGRQSVAGWAYEYGNGRVACLANGHTLEILQHPTYQKLLRNAALWLLHKT
jgi:type 1 glutamine amidotransferase